MEPMNRLDADTILSDAVMEEVFAQEDEIYKARLLLSLLDRAEELGVKKKMEMIIAAYKKADREIRRRQKSKDGTQTMLDNWTNFDGPYPNMYCGAWIAGEGGIYAQNSGYVEKVACYHPIIPVERMKNLETGREQIKLAFKRNKRWSEIIVPKNVVTSASKIVSLSDQGVAVTSETAKLLVKYLADVENGNDENIEVQYSTSKLGWHGNDFVPYDTDIVFDGDARFGSIFEAIDTCGSREKWYDCVKNLRRFGQIEIKMMLAASFASVLVSLLGALPFVADLWGETEGGKTVTLMLAASVWASPDENSFIGSYKGTEVGLEMRADFLNHLPMILDDTSKKNRRIEENFEGVVYDLCSGQGKSRSNKDLGLNRESHWRNCVLTNGERALSSYVSQGGAINRILEIECSKRLYDDPQSVLDVIKGNYGFAGREFVQVVKTLGTDRIREMQKQIQKELSSDDKMQKQSASLSVVLTADRIATDYLFKDGQYIDLEESKKVLTDRSEVSDNERCYRYLLDKIAMNSQRFDAETKCEKWGILENDVAVIYKTAFNELCRSGGFSEKAFLSWADRRGLIQTQGGRKDRVKRINGAVCRCVFLEMSQGDRSWTGGIGGDGFVQVDDGQMELPFDD